LLTRASGRDEPDSVIARTTVERFAGDGQVLSDDDAPVDQLLTTASRRRTR
jgi:hypothetical protein